MSHVLTLASVFIERMSNPAYGIKENEDYSFRLGDLLKSKDFESMLNEEITQISNPETLSPHGWLWLLSWARAKKISLDNSLLLDLCMSQSSVFMQVSIIDVATRQSEWEQMPNDIHLKEFKHKWLANLMHRCTDVHHEKESEFEYIDTRRSEMILVALMQVGSDITIDAAKALLHHQWIGHNSLDKYFRSLCGEMDEETKNIWYSRLNMPKSQSDD